SVPVLQMTCSTVQSGPGPLMPKIVVQDRSFDYEEVGSGVEALVLLSGLGGDHRAFAGAQRYFGGRFRTLSIDGRYVGQSDRAATPYATADLADDLAGCLDALDAIPAHVIGHSLGGLVAQELALRYPNAVNSLTLVSTHAGSDGWLKAVLDSWV